MIVLMTVFALTIAGAPVDGAQQRDSDAASIRSRIDARYEVIPLRDGIGLRPKDRASRIRMIEVADGSIAIDGNTVSGRELRDRLGADAAAIISLSYFDAEQRRAFLNPTAEPSAERPREPVAPPPTESSSSPSRQQQRVERRRVGERVHIFGGVTVPRDESVEGQVVAVLGSVRIDGHVSDQVVAVLGSVTLGPEAQVDGEIIAVGGRVNIADGARINGNIREISLRSPDMGVSWSPWWAVPFPFNPFDGTARLLGTVFRLFLLGLFGCLVLLLVRQPVERISQRVSSEPVKMAVVGLLAQLLFFPLLFLTVVILAVSIIGIPLLLLIPFVILTMLLVFLGGFTAVAYVVGGWGAARAGMTEDQPFLRVWIGVAIVLAPLLLARFFGVVGGPFQVGAFAVAFAAFMIEYVAWTTGFGAALTTGFERWRARRTTPADGIIG
jgi:hypothetical protein